ncbi:MAG: NFACT RNA binding domain-containing protein [Candidatus Izemoplasmatales bacterium]|jgi:predicted ribosome quality control (RQC) complex YloA/Tae2 family protein|nr:NFACT RNA binding domain-containing protein [Candidatus Izemoplasmatales bacterium]MDD4354442.1 NFACT RNA binding domain-containing protein [Candidatus Izemoplasmatales bacterium]MDD4987724.1 NFACT RNA binding domain-containing protein [Candidatus Izemoplasmatales bacterium]MDD5601482.1 NFACT RNA binding domain-containing protein [Candidatus Izemoplasmatales bacterium]
MSLDGRMLARLSEELNLSLATGKIQKITQLAKTDFLFSIRIAGKNAQLIFSLKSPYARLHLTDLSFDRWDVPGGFCMLLRKYLEGGTIRSIGSIEGDRLIKIGVENRDEVGDFRMFHLYLELMGRTNNLIVTDSDNQIIDAFRHVSPTVAHGRTIVKGAHYQEPLDEKIAPNDFTSAKEFFQKNEGYSSKSMVLHFRGFSPLIANYVIRELTTSSIPPEILYQSLLDIPTNPTLFIKEGKTSFYFFDLFPPGEKRHFPTLSKMLDTVFLESGKSEHMSQLTKNLLQTSRRELDKNIHKLEKLTQDLSLARQADILRIKGNLILENLHRIYPGSSRLEATAYELGKEVEIELNPTLKPLENAKLYFHKYKKAKASVGHLEAQLKLTRHQIDYFTQLLTQIEMASPTDLDEIAEEISIKKERIVHTNKAKKRPPNVDSYQDPEGIPILVGKNNLQNRFLTHELARKDEWWFHCKSHPGAHVIVRTTAELKESTIRMAAQLAALYSPQRFSSSVPVDFTRVRYVRRVPGNTGSMVTYTNQQTIFIDPDNDWLQQLRDAKK